jgi:hypothetical protein
MGLWKNLGGLLFLRIIDFLWPSFLKSSAYVVPFIFAAYLVLFILRYTFVKTLFSKLLIIILRVDVFQSKEREKDVLCKQAK